MVAFVTVSAVCWLCADVVVCVCLGVVSPQKRHCHLLPIIQQARGNASSAHSSPSHGRCRLEREAAADLPSVQRVEVSGASGLENDTVMLVVVFGVAVVCLACLVCCDCSLLPTWLVQRGFVPLERLHHLQPLVRVDHDASRERESSVPKRSAEAQGKVPRKECVLTVRACVGSEQRRRPRVDHGMASDVEGPVPIQMRAQNLSCDSAASSRPRECFFFYPQNWPRLHVELRFRSSASPEAPTAPTTQLQRLHCLQESLGDCSHWTTGLLRTQRPATLPSHFCFLSPQPFSFLCHSQSTVREQHSCRDSRPHAFPGTACPGAIWQLKSHLCQLPILQEKSDLATRPVQPDDVQRIVAHIAFSRATGRHTLSFSDQASSSLFHIGLLGQPFLHISPKSRV